MYKNMTTFALGYLFCHFSPKLAIFNPNAENIAYKNSFESQG
jgi:hypothetical protein